MADSHSMEKRCLCLTHADAQAMQCKRCVALATPTATTALLSLPHCCYKTAPAAHHSKQHTTCRKQARHINAG